MIPSRIIRCRLFFLFPALAFFLSSGDFGGLRGLLGYSPAQAFASIEQQKIHISDSKKNLTYYSDGIFTGGDYAVQKLTVKNIRFSKNGAYERIVLDLADVSHAPYYQLAINPDRKQLMFTLWGKAQLQYASAKVKAALKQSQLISRLHLYPVLEGNNWTFAMSLKSKTGVECFELTQPARIVIDLQKQ